MDQKMYALKMERSKEYQERYIRNTAMGKRTRRSFKKWERKARALK